MERKQTHVVKLQAPSKLAKWQSTTENESMKATS